MSDQSTSRPNGAEPSPVLKSLRDIAEDSYDQVFEEAGEPGEQPQVDGDGRQRDAHGRFIARTPAEEPGEQPPAEPTTQPREETPGQQPREPTQPAPAVSSEAPANWPQAAREMFSKQTPEGQAFLLERHTAMESDYQRRVQANATATQFTQSLGPIFNDPVIRASLEHNRLSALDAIREWASMHRRASSPNIEDRRALHAEIGQRLGLDPAATGQSRPGQQPPPGLSEKELADPAIRYFADHVSRTVNDVQALRGQIVAMQNATQERANAEAMRVTRWGIDGFAEEKGADGKPLRPDFDTVLPQIIELFEANPQRDLRDAYEQARWLNPTTRAKLIEAERSTATRQITDQRARQASRGNVRGLTSPVSKPPPDPGTKPRTLREVAEEAADEIGFGS